MLRSYLKFLCTYTWASWHVQNGTLLQALQQLAGWSSFGMLLHYAHSTSSNHLKEAAEKIVTNALHVDYLG